MTLVESLGSLFWPVKRPELLTYLISSLPVNLTFLLSDAAAMTGLTEEMKLSFEHRGKVVKFTPQWKVLSHPAVAFFIVSLNCSRDHHTEPNQSHLGSNSMVESILSEMPTIAFPFSADQSQAAYISRASPFLGSPSHIQLISLQCATSSRSASSFNRSAATSTARRGGMV